MTFWFTVIHTNVSEVTSAAAAALIVSGWAVTGVTVFLLPTAVAAVRWDFGLPQVLLVGGDARHCLQVPVKDHLGALGSFSCHCYLYSLLQCELLLRQEVLLQLRVVQPGDEQALDDGLTEVIHLLAGLA